VSYQLPRVDFELKLSFALASTASTGGAPAAPRMLARAPQPGGQGANGFTAEGTSTLRGSFVAVPLAPQRPPVRLTIGFKMIREIEVELVATVADALGVAQVGVTVEFNIDPDRSAALGGPDAVPLDEATRIKPAVVATDAAGRAVAVLHISERETPGALIAISVDALGVTETALMQAPSR
jgi:hypothetical protein